MLPLAELIEFINKFFKVKDYFQEAGEAMHKSIADYFLKNRQCLQGSAKQLKKGQMPSKRGSMIVRIAIIPEAFRCSRFPKILLN
jgi:hypothetical protein